MDTIGLKIKIFEKIFKFHRVKNRLDPRMWEQCNRNYVIKNTDLNKGLFLMNRALVTCEVCQTV
jgi:hypothetical protein